MGFWCERENKSGVKSDDTTFLVGVLCLLASWIAINNQISFTEKVLPMCMWPMCAWPPKAFPKPFIKSLPPSNPNPKPYNSMSKTSRQAHHISFLHTPSPSTSLITKLASPTSSTTHFLPVFFKLPMCMQSLHSLSPTSPFSLAKEDLDSSFGPNPSSQLSSSWPSCMFGITPTITTIKKYESDLHYKVLKSSFSSRVQAWEQCKYPVLSSDDF